MSSVWSHHPYSSFIRPLLPPVSIHPRLLDPHPRFPGPKALRFAGAYSSLTYPQPLCSDVWAKGNFKNHSSVQTLPSQGAEATECGCSAAQLQRNFSLCVTHVSRHVSCWSFRREAALQNSLRTGSKPRLDPVMDPLPSLPPCVREVCLFSYTDTWWP